MKKAFTKFQLAILMILFGFSSLAQTPNVIIANGGAFEFSAPYNDRATVGVYNTASQQYWVFDTIHVESVQDVVTDGSFAYVAAQDSIIKYNLTTFERVAVAAYPGVKSLTLVGGNLFVGKFYGVAPFLGVYTNSLTPLFDVSEIDNTVERIAIVGDSAYVPYNVLGTVDQWPPFGVYNDTLGKIAVIDLNAQQFVRDIELDTMGAGAKEIFNYNDQLYVVCHEKGVIAHYDPILDTVIYDEAGVSGGFGQVDSLVYLNVGFTDVGLYDLKNMQMINSSVVSPESFIAAALDTMNNEFYFNSTDYGSYGRSYIYNDLGVLIDSVEVNISPEGMAIYYQNGNSAPIANNDVAMSQGNANIGILGNDFDANGDSLTISILNDPVNGTAVVVGDSIHYTPTLLDADYVDSLQYQICDGSSACDSAWVWITIDGFNDISEVSFNAVRLFPNPTTGQVFLVGLPAIVDYRVFDINGRLVDSGLMNQTPIIDLSALENGMYFIELVAEEQYITIRVIKN